MTSTRSQAARSRPLYAALLLLSGAAALVHQLAWVRLFGVSVGSSHAAVATVLAAFFFGLAVGNLLAERWTRTPRSRSEGFGAFACLELGVGAGALVLFWALPRANAVFADVPVLAENASLRFATCFALLAVPAICMGATLPVFAASIVRREADLGAGLGSIYAWNTVGAAAGAILGGFVLVPRLGLSGAVHVAVFANLLVAGLAYAARSTGEPDDLRADAGREPRDGEPAVDVDAPWSRHALMVLALTGFVAIATEVAWTRALALLTGATLYGFATILAAFLLGIGLGSWFVRDRLAGLAAPARTLAAGLVVLGATLLGTRTGIAFLPELQAWAGGFSGTGQLAVRYALAFALLLPSTFVFGALYPLSLQLLCGGIRGMQRRLGRGFAVNTVAGIAGSLAAGFWLVPTVGTDGILLGGAGLILLGPLLFLRADGVARRAVPIGVGLLAVSFVLPGVSPERIVQAVGYRQDASPGEAGEVLYLEEGATGIVSVITHDGRVAQLANNGLQEAVIDLDNPRFGPVTEGLLGVLPYLLHPDPRSAFVVGFGGGTTVQTLAFTDLERIRVVELEPQIVSAVRSLHAGGVPCLLDPRVELTLDDARSRLMLEDERYDLIVSQPSHPWIAGAHALFTVEMFQLARSRLTEQGIMAQWLNLFRMDADVLRSVLGTFYSVFPHGLVAINVVTSDLILIGSPAPMRLSGARVRDTLGRHRDLDRFFALHELRRPGDLLWYFFGGREAALALADGAELSTDWNLLSEVRLAALTGDVPLEEGPWPLLERHASLEVLEYLDPADADRTLHEAGRFFVRFEAFPNAREIERQLRSIGAIERADALAAELASSPQAGAEGAPAAPPDTGGGDGHDDG